MISWVTLNQLKPIWIFLPIITGSKIFAVWL